MAPPTTHAGRGRAWARLREELRRALRRLRGGHLSPARGAAAVALGLFVGSQPVFGLHLPIVVFLCLWLRLDALVAYVATNVSNPFFAPALLTAEVELGALVRTGARLRLDHALDRAAALRLAGDLAVGAPLVGLALASVGGAVTFTALSARRRLRPDRATSGAAGGELGPDLHQRVEDGVAGGEGSEPPQGRLELGVGGAQRHDGA